MSETIITITTDAGARKDIRGEVLDADEVLAVHRSFGSAPTPPPWTLTHLPTGLAFVMTDDRAAAVDVGRVLLELKLPRAWRSRDAKTVVAALPEFVQAWLRECDAARRFVPMQTPSPPEAPPIGGNDDGASKGGRRRARASPRDARSAQEGRGA